ncbi:SDR family NAD(P)-dependent oxidoreductase [Actinotignum sanguinis]|uniref:SDR family oxidoreductase n=1 Tax=Actinotignum sanguinis TaxID=1445614 RepID=A0ABT5V753_9ACTO|nr:SDR family oxidoreductase [Actinotignum sanguinis]MDE1656783.1 SDR family oxidoreductase [Actinotignum sanguinis]
MSELKDKVVLITGADGNLGSGIARVFAQAGASVIVHSLRESTRANELAKELRDIGVSAFQVVGDICSEADVDEMIEAAFQQCGNVDVLVNNAGVQPVISLEEMTVEQWKQVVNVNLNGTFIVSKKMASRMVHANVAGSIINIASVEASIPAMNHAHYDASKAGVKMMTRNFALEFGKYGIRVNSVSPGLIDSDGRLAESWPAGYQSWMAGVPLRRTANTQDIGRACVFLASESASFISGHDLVVDGGMSAVAGWG